jgi:predicted CxxxxCH...CXXCH cytochrome family protein
MIMKFTLRVTYKELNMKALGRMEFVTRLIVTTLCSISLVILLAGTSQAALNCTSCHGNGTTDSHPVDTASGSAPTYRNTSTGAVKGNHNTHFSATTNGQVCAKCHGAAAASYTVGHAAMKHYSIQIGASMGYTKGTAFPQTSSPTLGTCSNVNCHFQTVTPTWGGVASFASQKTVADADAGGTCTKCHLGSTASPLLTGKHDIHNAKYAVGDKFTACVKCHPNFYGTTGSPAFTHATSTSTNVAITFAVTPNNGSGTVGSLRTAPNFLPSYATASAATCSATYCHKGAAAVPKWNDATTSACNICHDASTSVVGNMSTRHKEHYNTSTPATSLSGADTHTASAYVYSCLNCHPTDQHATGPADATGPVLQDAAVTGGTHITTYTQGGSSSTNNKGYNFTPGTCTTTCHTRDGSLAPVVPAVWSGASTGGCAVCHRASGDTYATMNAYIDGLSAVHKQHMATDRYGANTTDFTCAVCHTGTAATNTTLVANPTARNQHPDGIKNVSFAQGSWSGTQCQNTYCHSNGLSAAPTTAPLVSWTGTMAADCSSCHGGNASASAANRIASRVHAQHLYSTNRTGISIGCKVCHSATVSNTGAISSYTNHVNKSINVKYSTASTTGLLRDADNSQYNGVSTITPNGAAKAINTGGYTCATVYCHSTGNLGTSGNLVNAGGTKFKSVDWNGTALGCSGCHGDGGTRSHPVYASGLAGYSASNSHVKHVESSSITCDSCHYNTVTQTTTTPTQVRFNQFSGHLNRASNIRFKPNGGFTGSFAYGNAGATTKTCSSTYCHGTGPSTAWGGASVACVSCHTVTTVGGHNTHAAQFTARFGTMSANLSVGTTARFGCAMCHNPNTGYSNHTKGEARAGKMAADVFFIYTAAGKAALANYTGSKINGGSDGTLKWTTGTPSVCNNTYCHSNGRTNASGGFAAGTNATLSWALTGLTNGAQPSCTICHGDYAGAAALSGKHAQHLSTVNTGYGTAMNYGCVDCHSKTVSGNTVLSQKANHVNKMRDYSGLRAGKQANFNGTTCSNIYCHSDGKANYTVGNATLVTRTWAGATGALACTACHDNSSTATASAPHGKHTFSDSGLTPEYGITCDKCHKRTAASNTALVAGTTTHINGSYNVNKTDIGFATFKTYTGSYNSATKTCSATYCHSNGRNVAGGLGTFQAVNTQTWSGTTTCLFCHGGRTSATGDYARSSGSFRLTTSHSQHLKYGSASINCQTCHYKTAASHTALKTYSGVVHHVDGVRDVTFSGIAYSSYTSYKSTEVGAAVTTRTCNNNACHGGKSRNTWSDTVANNDNTCVHCHGVAGTPTSLPVANTVDNRKYFAPGYKGAGTSTDQLKGSSDFRVGAHFKHLSSAYMKNIKCNECHSVPSTPFEGNHMAVNRYNSQTLSFLQASSATVIGGATKTYLNAATFSGYTAGTATKGATCSSVYCHGSRLKSGVATNGTYTKPYWNYSAMINYTNPAVACGRCHGLPPSSVSASHAGATLTGGASPCSLCHGTVVNSSGVIINKNLHINGIVESTGHAWPYPGSAHKAGLTTAPYSCNGCHTTSTGGTYPPTPLRGDPTAVVCTTCHTNTNLFSTTSISCGDCHGTSAIGGRPNGNAFPNISGSHTLHVVGQSMACTACHSNGGTNNAAHGSSGGNKSINMTFVHLTSTTQQFHATTTATTATCSTITCHNNGTAVWGIHLTCASCHKYDSSGGVWSGGSDIVGGNGAGSHAKHIDFIKSRLGIATLSATQAFGTGDPAAVCGTCHTNTKSEHIDSNTRHITFGTGGTTNTMGAGTAFSMALQFGSSAPSFNSTGKTCSNLSCHYFTTPSWY